MIKLYIVIFLNLFLASKSFAHGFVHGVIESNGIKYVDKRKSPALIRSMPGYWCSLDSSSNGDMTLLTCNHEKLEIKFMISAACGISGDSQKIQTMYLEDDKKIQHQLTVFCEQSDKKTSEALEYFK